VGCVLCGRETQGCFLVSFVLYGMHHSFILPFSLFIKCFSSKSLLLDIPTPSHYHNRPSGQESHLSPQFYTKPPLLYSFAPLQNPTPINTSSSSLFHSSSFSSSLFPAASNREQGEKLLLHPLASIITTTTFNLHYFVRTGLSFWFGAVFFSVGKT